MSASHILSVHGDRHEPRHNRHAGHHHLIMGKKPAPAPAPTPTPSPAPAPAPAPVPTNAPLTLSQSTVNGVAQLRVIGTAGDDTITVAQSGQTYTLTNGTWSTTITGSFQSLYIDAANGNNSIVLGPSVVTNAILRGGSGNDTLVGGNASDAFYAGGGINQLTGGTGADLFVAIGSTGDTVKGGGGNDSFWLDAGTSEVVTDLTAAQSTSGVLHRVGSFLGFNAGGTVTAVSKDLLGQNLLDPIADYAYTNYAADPLFSAAGPGENDVAQGQVGDCYFLATLSSIAKLDPNLIRQSEVDLGDGTYAVQFGSGSSKTFVRVDADLPTFTGGGLAYANLGQDHSLWVAIMEKAFASYRYSSSSAAYASISSGWMTEVYTDLGCSATDLSALSASDLLSQTSSALTGGKSVTYGCASSPAGSNLVAGHAYTVDHISYDVYGNAQIVLRNPWGFDGYTCNDGSNDGYVTVTLAQFYAASMGIVTAIV